MPKRLTPKLLTLAEAARWSREYRKKHPDAFPVDKRELLRPERVKVKKVETKKKPIIRLK